MPESHYSVDQILTSLIDNGINVGNILDVGVRFGTPPLIDTFPDKKHYLFEPMGEYARVIQNNYSDAGIDYELIIAGCGEEDRDGELVKIFRKGEDKIPTHSQIMRPGITPTNGRVEKTPIISIDSFVRRKKLNGPFLLKVDVDGFELEVLRGAVHTIRQCSVVIIEVVRSQFFERIAFMHELGFAVHSLGDVRFGSFIGDVEDVGCYDTGFRQCDVVFLPADDNRSSQFCPIAGQKRFIPKK